MGRGIHLSELGVWYHARSWQHENREIRRLREHQKVEAVRRSVPDSPTHDRLLRYEASLERSFDRTLGQFERLQRMRLGQPVLPKLEVRHSMS